MEHKILPIPGFDGYSVSSAGEVFSSWITGTNPHIDPKKLKKLSLTKWPNGYVRVNLRVKRNTYYQAGVHRLICITFHGLPKKGYTASHLNGIRDDNRVENLVWESLSDNHKRKVAHGTTDRGSNNSRASLNKAQITALKQDLKNGKNTHQNLADKYGVSRVFVTKVNNGYRYKYD